MTILREFDVPLPRDPLDTLHIDDPYVVKIRMPRAHWILPGTLHWKSGPCATFQALIEPLTDEQLGFAGRDLNRAFIWHKAGDECRGSHAGWVGFVTVSREFRGLSRERAYDNAPVAGAFSLFILERS